MKKRVFALAAMAALSLCLGACAGKGKGGSAGGGESANGTHEKKMMDTMWGEESSGAELAGVAVPVMCTGIDTAYAVDGLYFVSQPSKSAFAALKADETVSAYFQVGSNDEVNKIRYEEYAEAEMAGASYFRFPVNFTDTSYTEDIYDLRQILDEQDGAVVITSPNASTNATLAYILLAITNRASREDALKTGLAMGMKTLHRAHADRYLDMRLD